MRNKIISTILTGVLITGIIPTITTSASAQLTETQLKEYVGTVLLSASGVNTNSSVIKKREGSRLFDNLVTSNHITFKEGGVQKPFSEIITGGKVDTSWEKSFKLVDGADTSIGTSLSQIPRIPEVSNLGPLHTGADYEILNGNKLGVFTAIPNGSSGVTLDVRLGGAIIDSSPILDSDTPNSQVYTEFKVVGNKYIRTRFEKVGNNFTSVEEKNITIDTTKTVSFRARQFLGSCTGYRADLVPYSDNVVASATPAILMARIPIGADVIVDNIGVGDITTDGNMSWDNSIQPSVKVKLNNKSTIAINATVNPYLEVTLDKNAVDFNTTDLSAVTSNVSVGVKSNLNYKIESKFSGLKNADNSVTIDNTDFKLSSNGTAIALPLNSYSVVNANQLMGINSHPLVLTLGTGRVIKSDTYTGSLEIKVSQL